MEEKRKLGRKTGGRRIVSSAGRIKGNACFCGVGNHEAQFWLARAIEKLRPVALGIQAPGSSGDNTRAFHSLPVLTPTQDQCIETILFRETIRRFGMPASRLNQHNFAVQASLLVHLINKMVCKSAQEVAFAKLHDALRRVFKQITGIAQFFERLKCQSIHDQLSFTG